MKCIPVTEPNGPLAVVERETPSPGPGQILIEIEKLWHLPQRRVRDFGRLPGLAFPRVPGHEIAGKVAAVGDDVTVWKAGDRVGVGWHGGHCFKCGACSRADFLNCAEHKITGISHDGGWATHVVVPWESAARIPDELPATEAGPLLCAGITTFNALRNSGARPGDTVAVLGVGGLGHLGVQYARNMGFRTVALSRGPDKKQLASQLGAHDYIDTADGNAAEALLAIGGADVVLATAPSAKAIADAFGGLKARGTMLIVAAAMDPLSITPMAMLSGKRIQGWPSGSASDSEEAMQFSSRFGVKPQVETFPLEQAGEALAKCLENKVRFRSVLVP